MREKTKKWIEAATIRAIRTFAQTACGLLTVGLAMNEIEWLQVLSVATVAAIYSILTSMAGLPEAGTGLYNEDLENPWLYEISDEDEEDAEDEEDPEDITTKLP